MNAPWLSIIVPMYNVGEHLDFFLDGLFSQPGLDGVQVIFVDDGSTDGTPERLSKRLARRLPKQHARHLDEDPGARRGDRTRVEGPWTQLERLEQNAGVSAARNHGLALAAAPYALFLDADDTLTAGAIAGVRRRLTERDDPADVLLFEFRPFEAANRALAQRLRFAPLDPIETDPDRVLEAYLSGALVKRVHLSSTLFRTAFLLAKGLGFDESLAYGEDQRFMVAALAHGPRIERYPSVFLGYVNYQDSATGVFSWRGFEVHTMMAGLRDDPLLRAAHRTRIERRMNRLLVGLLNHHLDHFGVRQSRAFLRAEIRPRVVPPRGVRLGLAFSSLPLYAALWWGYDRGRRGVRGLAQRVRLKGVGVAFALLASLLVGLTVPSVGGAQQGTRALVLPVPASVPEPARSRAMASDARMVAGDLSGALAALWGEGGLPSALALALPSALAGGGPPLKLPDFGDLRALARTRPAVPGGVAQLGGEPLPGATGSYELAWRAARIAMAFGVLAPTDGERGGWHRWGVVWGAEAVLLDSNPRGTDSRFWLLANLGRLALEGLPATDRGRASEALYDLAQAILAEDPNHPGAHTILGRNHLEIRSLNLATRTLARVAFGNEFVNRSTFEGALHHLERGARGDPQMLYYQMEWAHGLAARGNRDEARRIWERVQTLPDRLPIDGALKAEARRRLEGR